MQAHTHPDTPSWYISHSQAFTCKLANRVVYARYFSVWFLGERCILQVCLLPERFLWTEVYLG